MRNNVRSMRKAKEWTITDLHLASGVSMGNISDIETGKKIPLLPTAQKLAGALGADVNEVFPPGQVAETANDLATV